MENVDPSTRLQDHWACFRFRAEVVVDEDGFEARAVIAVAVYLDLVTMMSLFGLVSMLRHVCGGIDKGDVIYKVVELLLLLFDLIRLCEWVWSGLQRLHNLAWTFRYLTLKLAPLSTSREIVRSILEQMDWLFMKGLDTLTIWVDPFEAMSGINQPFMGPSIGLQQFDIYLFRGERPISTDVDIQALARSYSRPLRAIGGPSCEYRITIEPISEDPAGTQNETSQTIPRSQSVDEYCQLLVERLKVEFEASLKPVGWRRLSKVV